jgi:hypothetical protein
MDFRYEPREGFLLVEATGPFDAVACRAAMGEIGRLCAERGLARVLVDARAIAEVVSIADRFGLASGVASARLPRIAILVNEANATYSRTFENTALNRGAMVRTTASPAEASGFLGIAMPTSAQAQGS